MALPNVQPDPQEDAETGVAVEARDRRTGPPRSKPSAAGHTASPARRLQRLLEVEMQGRRAPSIGRSMTPILVLSLACSVAALSLYGFGWL